MAVNESVFFCTPQVSSFILTCFSSLILFLFSFLFSPTLVLSLLSVFFSHHLPFLKLWHGWQPVGEEVTRGQGFSIALLVTLGASKSLLWEARLHVGCLSAPLGLCPLDASNSYPTLSCDNQGCLQILPNVPYSQHYSKYIL